MLRWGWLSVVLVLAGCSATTAPPAPVPVRSTAAASEVAGAPGDAVGEQSVVHLAGVAPSCVKKIEGTGFVYAPQRVVTPAHVVAGVRPVSVRVTAADGEVYKGRVVAFDPDVDVAVLYVPDLPAPALWLDVPGGSLGGARLLGYPKRAKGVVAQPVEILDRFEAEGPDIYKRRQVTRTVLELAFDVRPGISGAPLLVEGGTVAGMVVAATKQDPKRGYALAAEEILPIAKRAAKATKHVSTRKCDAGP
ncbi:trypsin-like peptidase domain-containing protein [Nonomuraea sp. NPDC049504]|uniref:trypsin-like peptidase domain-containing protein n=1 Tax=Nonomuraea sp. NPDC049504 TaxID=3154729 RepID=UPI00342D39BC